ncbi:MAG TPA: DegT/DnrJ/EryC1/StrS family aminotransferase [Candidatus Binatia bacterium]|nr:DegT/DnrJ/EryC1/StrS family aminotransferase [Candidatus Binatia bacterium]
MRGFADVCAHGAFVLGPEVAAFEAAYARFSGVAHCIGVANGTDALELALRAAGVGAGDEVVLPANTFVATALAVVRAGAVPVLVDCDPLHFLIDPHALAAKVGARTRAIVPVHLYGQIAPMEEVARVATGAGVAVVEDAAQAHGATRHGTGAGGFGVVAATSFYPGKNLGAYGDAGAVLATSAEIAAKVRALRNYGSEVKYEHPERGFNSRLDTLQAVVLSAKLARLATWNEARAAAAARYATLLADVPRVRLPGTLPGNRHVWHLYVVRVPERDRVLAHLAAAGIGAGTHYPVPIHLQGAFRDLAHRRGDFPVAEAAAAEILSLPIFPGITAAQQERVVRELRAALG